MKRLILRSLSVAALSAGAALALGSPAQADMTSGPNAGILSGNQSSTVIQAPVSVCGNAVAIFGFASAQCQGGAYASNGSSSGSGASVSSRTWSRWKHWNYR
jgi:hypothetical protein